ncbi:MAG: hypothetical protein RSA20_08790 [Oscillospiraceae bacterium]
MRGKAEQKTYYIPPKLARKSMVGPYSVTSAIIGLSAFMVFFTQIMRNPILSTPLIIFAVAAFEIEGRTVGRMAYNIMRFIVKDKKYSLREAIENEDDRPSKIQHKKHR